MANVTLSAARLMRAETQRCGAPGYRVIRIEAALLTRDLAAAVALLRAAL